ncbi:MAG TPA: hypothetical protein VJ876_06330 [Bacteroidales bacterium]|nr:hypothetical protein [Bacteroidales bacterium]
MGKITRNNYEEFFLDYLDGKMTGEQQQELHRFLEDNSDLKEELAGLEHTLMAPAGMEASFPDKGQLKKSLTLPDQDYTLLDELCIARLEGDLSPVQQEEFELLLREQPRKQKTFRQYERTRLEPDTSLIFAHKEQLKKGGVLSFFIRRNAPYLAMAATVLLLAGLHLFFPKAGQLELPSGENGMRPSVNEPVVSQEEIPARQQSNAAAEAVGENIDYDKLSHAGVQPEMKGTNNLSGRAEAINRASMTPMQPRWGAPIKEEPVLAQLKEPSLPYANIKKKRINFDAYQKMDRILDRQVAYALQQGIREPKFSLWDIADLGLEGISKLTGKELTLERHYNNQGKLQKMAFRTESFAMSTQLD